MDYMTIYYEEMKF